MDHAVDEDEDDENGNFVDDEAGETKPKKKKKVSEIRTTFVYTN